MNQKNRKIIEIDKIRKIKLFFIYNVMGMKYVVVTVPMPL